MMFGNELCQNIDIWITLFWTSKTNTGFKVNRKKEHTLSKHIPKTIFESRTLFPKVCFIYISFFLIQLGVQPIILKQFYIYMAEFHLTINKM